MFAFFQLSGSLTSHQDLPKTIELGLAMTSASVPGSAGAVTCSIYVYATATFPCFQVTLF